MFFEDSGFVELLDTARLIMLWKQLTLQNKVVARLVLISSVGFSPSFSSAAEWTKVGEVDSQFGPSVVELDSSSIRNFTSTPEQEELEFQRFHSKVRSAWFRISFSPTEVEGQTISSGLIRLAVNCDINQTQTEQMIVYSGTRGTGKKLASTQTRSLWVDIVPDSLPDLARRELC
ncbi:surface-adhesin E family protein [Massilia aerilata]|uniref:Surface-adhesin E family protein n=1 Tax=Massilia aerilata TaxID=453817 RepID=A0ABW0S0Z0_9BURK